jgi:alpha-1,3-rhamnosyl/mannosyltransferase
VDDTAAIDRVGAGYGIARPYIFYLGNFKPHKNVQALIGAYAALPEGLRQHYPLVLGGREDIWQASRRQLADDMGLGETVRFIGQVAEEDMPALYSGAELFVFPSLYEGFGLPPLEAMACGTAVVASALTSIPEVVAEAGCLVDVQDVQLLAAAMQRVLEDRQERDRMQQKGLERAAQFRSADICQQQLEILERVVRAGR